MPGPKQISQSALDSLMGRDSASTAGITKAGYEKAIAEVLERMPSGGFKGKLNIYTCELVEHLDADRAKFSAGPGCGAIVLTRDVDVGVTPAFIRCETCGGNQLMSSSMYRVYNQAALEGSQWYRPTFEEFQKLPPASREHVLHGGLVLRPYKAD